MTPVDPRLNPQLLPEGSRPVVIGEDQPEVQDLPSIRTPMGQVITRWELTEAERRALFNGQDIYLTILSPGPVQPVVVEVGPPQAALVREGWLTQLMLRARGFIVDGD